MSLKPETATQTKLARAQTELTGSHSWNVTQLNAPVCFLCLSAPPCSVLASGSLSPVGAGWPQQLRETLFLLGIPSTDFSVQ